MIQRALQRCNTTSQSIASEQSVLFDRAICSWTSSDSALIPITYRSGTFSIPSASYNDYLVTWTLSIRTSTKLDGLSNLYLLRIKYGNGAVTEENSCVSITPTGIINGFKIIHIKRVSTTDLLTFSIVNNSLANTMYLNTFRDETSSLFGEINNASICVFSI